MADPVVGERRTFDGQLGEWDGKGWKAVSADASVPRPRTWGDTATDALPMVGGAIGGAVGNVPGAAIGGAAGEGFRQIARNASQLPGAVADVARNLVDQPKATLQGFAGGAGSGAVDAGEQGAVQGAFEGGGQVAMAGLRKIGPAVYRGYLKPSLSRVNLGKADEVVRTAIDEGIAMTKGGLQHTQEMIGQLNGKVNDLLSQATGKTVDLHEIADSVRAWATRMYDRPGRDPRDLKAALSVADRIDNHPSMTPTPPMARVDAVDMPTANVVKGDLQTPVADKFGLPGGTATTRTEKYASAAMRGGIERQVPEVGPLNMQESKLIDLARSLERGLARDANTQKIYGARPLMAMAMGTGTGIKTRNPYAGVVTALATEIGLQPAVATRAAILATKIGEQVPGTAAADVARAAVQATLESQRSSENP